MSRTVSRLLIVALVAVFAVSVFGCMSGYRTSTKNGHEKVYYVDEDGNKKLVYETAKDGTVTIHDESDPRAQQVMQAQAAAEKSEIADLERIKLIETAPRRAFDDPIRVILYDIELGPKLAEVEHSDHAIYREVAQHFEKDEVIRLVSGNNSTSREIQQMTRLMAGESTKTAPPSDVDVVSRAYLKEVYGLRDGKPASAWYVAFEARITCNYLPAEITVTEEGNMFRNAEVSRLFAEKIKNVIKNEIGPTLPADRSL
jgi:hypothetical protein